MTDRDIVIVIVHVYTAKSSDVNRNKDRVNTEYDCAMTDVTTCNISAKHMYVSRFHVHHVKMVGTVQLFHLNLKCQIGKEALSQLPVLD